jgi:hypothetical protein
LSFYLRSLRDLTPRDPDGAMAAYRDALEIGPSHERESLEILTKALIAKAIKSAAGETPGGV